MKRIERNHRSELVAAGTKHLAELAEQGEHVEYGQCNDRVCGGQFNLSDASERDQLGRLLEDISQASVREHGVMLSALVHHKGNLVDLGKGFFTLAVDLGRLEPKADDLARAPKADDLARALFLGQEIEAVHEMFGGRLWGWRPEPGTCPTRRPRCNGRKPSRPGW